MSTLATVETFVHPSDKTAVVIPRDSPAEVTKISYKELVHQITILQQQLTSLGICSNEVISISLTNGLEFIITFLATCWQRAIAAPLNPGYKKAEVDFYVKDVKSSLIIVPEGAYDKRTEAVQAAQNLKVAIAECVYTQHGVQLNIKERALLAEKRDAKTEKPVPEGDDVALILHTSGTTGRPKAV